MSTTTRRVGRTYRAPRPMCKQCDRAPRLSARVDGLCKSCGHIKDLGQNIAAEAATERK